jgi:cytoskeletal protein CcmA (bactofilin family)
MFGKSERQKSGGEIRRGGGIVSMIGADVVIAGDVATGEELRVDGRIEGNVRCGALDQGEGGEIRGDIEAERANLAGVVSGKVTVRELVLEATARLSGDVCYQSLSIVAGARIEGRLSCRCADAAEAAPAGPGPGKARMRPETAAPVAELFAAAAE